MGKNIKNKEEEESFFFFLSVFICFYCPFFHNVSPRVVSSYDFVNMDFLAEKFSGKGHDNDFAFHQILGRPLPLDEHACSVSLPTWADVVGYEEGDPRVSDALKIGYPRFKIHASIERLMDLLLLRHNGQSSSGDDIPAMTCMIWPTATVAEAFRCFLTTYDSHLSSLATVVSVGFEDLHGVLFPDESGLRSHAKKYWQHTGEIISSRLAEAALQALGAGCVADWSITRKHSRSSLRQSSSDLHMQRLLSEWSNGGHYNATLETLCKRIAGIVEEPRESVTLCISGMSAIFAALKSLHALVDHAMAAAADAADDDVALSEETKQARLRRLHEFGKVVVFGFPYLVSALSISILLITNPPPIPFIILSRHPHHHSSSSSSPLLILIILFPSPSSSSSPLLLITTHHQSS